MDPSLQYILEDMKKDQNRHEEHLLVLSGDMHRTNEQLKNITSTLNELSATVQGTDDKPSIVERLNETTNTVNQLKFSTAEHMAKVDQLLDIAFRIPGEVSKERWKAVAKVAGLATLALPGLLSLLGVHF